MRIHSLVVPWAAGLLVVAGGTVLAEPITVENSSFELPGTSKQKSWENVPGWNSDTVAADSGVETGYTPTEGDWTAFLMRADPSVYQLTDHTIAAGEIFTLTVDARITWLATHLQMDLYYDDGGNRMQAATDTVALGDAMAEYSLVFAADDVPASIGHGIGIEFNNVTAEDGSWLGLDNVRLDVVPEPSTFVLAALGLLGLWLYARRRRGSTTRSPSR
jgi:hypothetical protein